LFDWPVSCLAGTPDIDFDALIGTHATHPNGFNTVDVIGTEPGFLSRAWQWITE
jgi:hypothetical protein